MSRLPQRRAIYGRIAALGLLSVMLAACAAGDARFTTEGPAGFWLGIWHGLISFVTLIIGIFNDNVGVYEVHNTGGWYDFGFLLGVTALWGHRTITHRCKREVPDAEWDEISRKVEAEFKRKIRQWAEAEPDDNWNLVEQKAEDKLKRQVREWAERD
ncbi:MAG: hypothetical protein ACKV2T_35825 [Kofleriaceae bacterium]